ncbi:MAG: hypothetical protein JO022_21230, partial [Acidobacteriaceae bacterium]|nr:hypothetical protein [Acidobacteriaceae bacterium]
MKRVLYWTVLLPGSVLLAAIGVAIIIAQSNWFQNQVRAKVIMIVEDATGGRLEVGKFRYDWRTLTAAVEPFVLHGTEPQNEPPLLHAKKVQIGLRITSLLQRQVDLRFLHVDVPAVHVSMTADGHTNIPEPRLLQSPTKNLMQDILNLRIQDFRLRNGSAEYNSFRVPLNVSARNVEARFGFDSRSLSYAGRVASREMVLDTPGSPNVHFGIDSQVVLNRRGLDIKHAELASEGSHLELSGGISDPASPRGDLNVNALVRLADVNHVLRVPIGNSGEVAFKGQLSFTMDGGFHWEVNGNADAKGLGYHDRFVNIDHVNAASTVKLQKDSLELPKLTVSTSDGTLHGRLQFSDWRRIVLDGDMSGVSLRMLASHFRIAEQTLEARMSGPLHASALLTPHGFLDTEVRGRLTLAPVSGNIPMEGFVDASYQQRTSSLNLGNSALTLGGSRVDINGTVGQVLHVHATSLDPADLKWALPLIGVPLPEHLPVLLPGGSGKFDG